MEVVQVSLNTFRSPTTSLTTGYSITSKELDETDFLPPLETSTKSSESDAQLTVPDNTPHSSFSFCHNIDNLPTPFPDIFSMEIPYIREIGVKAFITHLGEFFNCHNFMLNKVHFWFLDIITDCFWKLQDDFKFPEVYQKVIIGWMLYAFDLIRDPRRNLSRKEFFESFNEAILAADERVQAGCKMLPLPQDLFQEVQDTETEEISLPSKSQSSSVSLMSSGESYVAVGIDESLEMYKIPKITEKHKKQTNCLNETTSIVEEQIPEELQLEEEEKFYQPDYNTPPRFYSSSGLSSTSSSSFEDADFEIRKLWKRSSFVSHSSISEDMPAPTLNESDEENNVINEWLNYLDQHEDYIEDIEFNKQINTCALKAIKELVYYNFYENFQYKIIKLALLTRLNSITKAVNTEWNIPKILKTELKKPKPKKEKKKKKKKKKEKKHKKNKHKKKKSLKTKKKKKSKKSKSKKSSKPKKLTKAELARLKREKLRLEEEARKEEENRRMIFPLNDAVNDEFFKTVFENWKKPKSKKKRKHSKKRK